VANKAFAGVAVQVDPGKVLLVHVGGDRRGHAAQQIASLGQVGVVKAQQTGGFTPAQAVFVDLGGLAAGLADLQLEGVAVPRVGRGLGEAHGGGLAAQHQGLVGEKDADRAVVHLDGGGLHLLVELAEQVGFCQHAALVAAPL